MRHVDALIQDKYSMHAAESAPFSPMLSYSRSPSIASSSSPTQTSLSSQGGEALGGLLVLQDRSLFSSPNSHHMAQLYIQQSTTSPFIAHSSAT